MRTIGRADRLASEAVVPSGANCIQCGNVIMVLVSSEFLNSQWFNE